MKKGLFINTLHLKKFLACFSLATCLSSVSIFAIAETDSQANATTTLPTEAVHHHHHHHHHVVIKEHKETQQTELHKSHEKKHAIIKKAEAKNEVKAEKHVKKNEVKPPVLPSTSNINNGINSIILSNKDARLAKVHVGVIVKSMDTGSVLYQYNADHLFTPASVQKLFTATAALSFLKPNFRFATELFTTGNIVNGTLMGDLYLKFTGDPTLRSLDIGQLFTYLHANLGVNRIQGRVYVDNFAYNNVAYPPGCLLDDLLFGFAAPMNAILVNHNIFSLVFIPTKPGELAEVKTSLPPGSATLINDVHTENRSFCPLIIQANDENVYKLSGCVNRRWGKQGRSLAIRDMVPYGKALAKERLTQNGIAFSGEVEMKPTPGGVHLLAVHYSEPLATIIKGMLKESDNLVTNSIFKKLGEAFTKGQGSWRSGIQAVEQILSSQAGIDFDRDSLYDGAGLSKYNLIAPRQLVQVLSFVYHNKEVHQPLLVALPIAGKDGTLRHRMPQEGRSERVHAKTGTMKGVTSLAGYVYTHNNGTLAFAVMINGYSGAKYPYTHIQDEICEYLINAGKFR